MRKGKDGFYNRFTKRLFDIIGSLFSVIFLGWLYIIVVILVRINLGAPVIYTDERVGKNGKIFKLYKFRSMSNAKGLDGELLPDIKRLTKFGKMLRASSLDELPEVFNVLLGNMSFIGPRPLPKIYMDYYTLEELHRHDVRPGLSGWAQVNGRNSISWDKKFKYDLEYVENVSLKKDFLIIFLTIKKVLIHEGIGQGEEHPGSLYDYRKKRQSF